MSQPRVAILTDDQATALATLRDKLQNLSYWQNAVEDKEEDIQKLLIKHKGEVEYHTDKLTNYQKRLEEVTQEALVARQKLIDLMNSEVPVPVGETSIPSDTLDALESRSNAQSKG